MFATYCALVKRQGRTPRGRYCGSLNVLRDQLASIIMAGRSSVNSALRATPRLRLRRCSTPRCGFIIPDDPSPLRCSRLEALEI